MKVLRKAAGLREEQLYAPSQWQLMWWKFRRHKLAMAGGVILIIFYLVAIFAEFVAPYDPEAYFARYKLAPPTPIRIIDTEGNLHRPFIYQRDRVRREERCATTTLTTSRSFGIPSGSS